LRRLFSRRPPSAVALIGVRDAHTSAPVTLRCASALAAMGRRTVVIDACQGDDSIADMLGLASARDFAQVLRGEASLAQIMVEAGDGVHILPAARAARPAEHRTPAARQALERAIQELSAAADIVVVHAAGVTSQESSLIATAARRTVYCVPTDAEGITAAYRLLKRMASRPGRHAAGALMVDGATAATARAAFENMRSLAAARLGLTLDWVGWLPGATLHCSVSGRRSGSIDESWTGLARLLTGVPRDRTPRRKNDVVRFGSLWRDWRAKDMLARPPGAESLTRHAQVEI